MHFPIMVLSDADSLVFFLPRQARPTPASPTTPTSASAHTAPTSPSRHPGPARPCPSKVSPTHVLQFILTPYTHSFANSQYSAPTPARFPFPSPASPSCLLVLHLFSFTSCILRCQCPIQPLMFPISDPNVVFSLLCFHFQILMSYSVSCVPDIRPRYRTRPVMFPMSDPNVVLSPLCFRFQIPKLSPKATFIYIYCSMV